MKMYLSCHGSKYHFEKKYLKEVDVSPPIVFANNETSNIETAMRFVLLT